MAERRTAIEMAKDQHEISISEFFEKNKHLLGFDNPTKALLISVKEAVDNSIDAAEEAGILSEINISVKNVRDEIFLVKIQDNGPGIVREQVPMVFGKLLYGSKFHRFRQSMGQQGIGISAVCLYSQLTTGKPMKIYSKIEGKKETYELHIRINTKKNEPEILYENIIEDGPKAIKDHGIRLEFEIIGRYRKSQGVDSYLEQISISNPFVKIKYSAPDGRKILFNRAVKKLPKEPKEIKPHPYGIELGILIRIIEETKTKTISKFLQTEFSSVGATSANEICKRAKINKKENPKNLSRDQLEKIMHAMQNVKLQRPPTDVLSPIGKEELERGLRRRYPDAEFIAAVSRHPEVYRGIPFQVEAAIVHDSNNFDKDKQIKLMRFANRVPLLYQAGACASYESVTSMSWKRYGIAQSGKSLPVGPYIIVVHLCSSWVPFISESKEAIASYPAIIKEMKLALQDCGRDLKFYLSRKMKAKQETKRLHIFEDYIPEIIKNALKLAENDKKLDSNIIIEKVIKRELIDNENGSNK